MKIAPAQPGDFIALTRIPLWEIFKWSDACCATLIAYLHICERSGAWIPVSLKELLTGPFNTIVMEKEWATVEDIRKALIHLAGYGYIRQIRKNVYVICNLGIQQYDKACRARLRKKSA